MVKVVITDFIDVRDALKPERAVLDGLAEVTAVGAREDSALVGLVEDASALITFHYAVITERTLNRLECCRVISRAGVGYENVDIAAARARGIPVVHVPDYGSEEVADSAIGFMLALMRGIHYTNSRLRADQGEWSYEQAAPCTGSAEEYFPSWVSAGSARPLQCGPKRWAWRSSFMIPFARTDMTRPWESSVPAPWKSCSRMHTS